VNDLATLVWLAQQDALELHAPQWRFGRDGTPRTPDRLVLDLDPGEGAGLPECVEVAKLARAILRDMGLDPMPVTSGSKGVHLYAALDGRRSSDQVSALAKELARALESDHPDLVVSDMKKTLRGGKVLVDWSQNNGSKTTVVPYSLRGREHPTVAAPRTWRELSSPTLRQLEFTEVLERLATPEEPPDAPHSTILPTTTGIAPVTGRMPESRSGASTRATSSADMRPRPTTRSAIEAFVVRATCARVAASV